MVEVSNINTESMSKSEIKNFNKDIAELQESVNKLNNLQSALENKINISDNSIISTLINQIESTRQFAMKTIEEGKVSDSTNKEILRSSYEAIQTILKDNRKEFVVNSNNQIVTLKHVLDEYKEEQKQERLKQEEKEKSIASRESAGPDATTNLVQGAEKSLDLLNELATGTQLGMLVQTTYKPIKYLSSILSSFTKGTVGSARSVGNAVSDMFHLPSINKAKSLEKEKSKADQRREKDTNRYRQQVLSKLDDMTDGIKKVKSGESSEEGFSWIKFLLGGLATAGIGKLIWDNILSDESKDRVKNFVSENITTPIGNYLREKFPTLSKIYDHEKEVSERKDEIAERQEKEFDNSILGSDGNLLKVEKDDSKLTAGIKGTVSGLAKTLAKPGMWLERTIEAHLKRWDPLKKYHDKEGNRTDTPNYVEPTKYIETGDRKADILSYLKSKGYTDEAASGIYGNIMQESKGDPLAFNKAGGGKGAFGMFQWRADRQDNLKKWAKDHGRDYKDWKTQIDFAIQEEEGKISPAKMNQFRSSDEAARYVRDKFERSGETDKSKGGISRSNYAKEGMNKLAKMNITPDTGVLVAASDIPATPTIKSADAESLKLDNNKSTYDTNTQSNLLASTQGTVSEELDKIFGGMNNSLTKGFSSVTEAINNQSVPNLASNVDDPGTILINSGGA